MKLIVILENRKFHKKLNLDSDSTTELIKKLSELLSLKQSELIATCRNHRQQRLRIVKGWTLSIYGVTNGGQIYVKILQNTDNVMALRKSPLYVGIDTSPAKKMQAINEEICQNQNENEIKMEHIHKNVISLQPMLERSSAEFDVTIEKYYDDVLLKVIQNEDLDAFKKALDYSKLVTLPQINQCEKQYYKSKMLDVLKQPGSNGWGALHVAIYCNKLDIVVFLLSLNIIDINKQSLDGWTPLQLAIQNYKKLFKENSSRILQVPQILKKKGSYRQTKQWKILEIILNYPKIDVNMSTFQNINPIEQAVLMDDINLLKILIQKNADPFQVNFANKTKTIMDICLQYHRQNILEPGNKCILLLKQQFILDSKENKKARNIINVYRGQVTHIRSFPQPIKKRYVQINPQSNVFIIYKSHQDYPKKPMQMFLLSNIEKVQKFIQNKEAQKLTNLFHKLQRKVIHKQVQFQFHIQLVGNKLLKFSCAFEQTVNKWLRAFDFSRRLAKQFQENVHLYSINTYKIEEVCIVDHLQKKNGNGSAETKPSLKSIKNKSQYNNLLQVFANSPKKEAISSPKKEQSNKQIQSPSKISDEGNNRQIQPLTLQTEKKIKYSDFKFLTALGEGAFGRVFLVQYIPTNKKYALKVLSKKQVIIQKQLRFVASELNILKKLDFPYVIKMHFTYQTPNYVYMGLDYCESKDLSYHIIREGFFSQEDSAFYAAQLILALDYLHSKNILYRDLKPQNVLLTKEGHIKLTDFGLSKELKPADATKSRQTFCGSPAYLSPEMLNKAGARKQTDYYGLGTIIYQMMVGEPPYYDEDINVLYKNIKEAKLKFPKHMSQKAKSLLKGLLQKDPEKRLGSKSEGGVESLKQHPFFKEIDWKKLQVQQLKAPVRGTQQQQMQNYDELQFLTNTLHSDRDYDIERQKVNRFNNFSFARQSFFQK